MRSRTKKAYMFLTMLVSLAFPVQMVIDNDDGNGPPKHSSVEAKSVLTGPILSTASPQDRPGRRFQRQQKVDKTPLNAAKVRKAVKLAVQYLKENQKADGSWKAFRPDMDGDTTALCTLALLNSEELPPEPYKNSPHIKRALEYLVDVPNQITYVVALRIMVMTTADPQGNKYRLLVKNDVDWLIDKQMKNGPTKGGWHYGPRGQGDSSNSQFALLALHEASQMGIKVPQETWQLAMEYWRKCNDSRSGGFTYYVGRNDPKGSMTCAGISSVIIANENLADAAQLVNGDFANCCVPDAMQKVVDSAFGWLEKHYTVQVNPLQTRADPTTKLYYLYGLERAGRLAGRRFIGPNDWYRDGAKQLLKTQHPHNDYWQNNGSSLGENDPLIATSFALLFLSKGKRPVVIGKYDHGAPDWDLHPKGVHYLTRRLEKVWNVKLNWQTVKAENATVDDLLEAPVLFMSGRDLIELNQTQKDNLKKYLENGGFLFAEACQGDGCGNDAKYHVAFVELMAELFPESKLEALARNHPIWNSHFPVVASKERPLLGLQACCRTSVVYCPKNLSCYWNLDRPAILDDPLVSKNLKKRVEYCTELGINVLAYATDRFNLKEKGETPTLVEQNRQQLTDRVLVFPKLQHGGGDDDAPNAWRNVLRNVGQLGLEIKMDKKMIPAAMDDLADHPFIFMHGRNRFTLSNEEREALQKHLEFGGFIFADSICASQEFTDSFRKEMSEILGNRPLVPIDSNHKIWSQEFGYKLDRVTMRTKTKGGTFTEKVTSPQLEGAEINGRLAIVFSPHDLSCALENTAKSQCTGYTHEESLRITMNVLLYSLLSD